MIRWLLVLLAGCSPLAAQRFTFGAKLGAPLTDDSQVSPLSVGLTSRWSGGPFVELHLPRRFSVEFSTLLRTSRENEIRPFQLGQAQNPYLITLNDKVKTWDFPVLLKYRFTRGTVRPFFGAGAAWSHRRSELQVVYSCLGPQGSCRTPEYSFDFTGGSRSSTLTRFGPAASAGFEILTKRLTISPEVRWNRSFSGGPTRNHFAVMVSFGFRR